jgi:type II restriction enzyme
MKIELITKTQIEKRKYWIDEIIQLSGNFGADTEKVEQEISVEIASKKNLELLLGHLRLCGAIPEQYRHDSSEEKLYSKYTDVVISKSFEILGITSLVLKERADAADVECVTKNFSFVADAKAFRLSRTAKNQKDFKIQAMDNWKRGKPFAMVVCPIYQLPNRTSQIYKQAENRSVTIFSFTHLAVLTKFALIKSQKKSVELLHEIFKLVEALHPSKSALNYWVPINKLMVGFDKSIRAIWLEEKKASDEAIYLAKEEALTYLAAERERIMKLSREQAIREVIKASKIENKMIAIKSVSYNGLLTVDDQNEMARE